MSKILILLIFTILFFEDFACFEIEKTQVKSLKKLKSTSDEKVFQNAKILKSQSELILELSDRKVNLLNVPDVRQSTIYTCGPASLLAVFGYYSVNETLREMKLAQMANTNEIDGTTPQNMVKTAQILGFTGEIKYNMSSIELEWHIMNKQPVIVDFQAWPDDEEWENDWENDWIDGHYAVAIGFDQDYFYFEDPSLIGSVGYINKIQFQSRWHDVEQVVPQKYYNLGIIIRSPKNPQKLIIRNIL